MYKQLVHNTLQIENKIAIVNNSLHVFKKKWSCFKSKFSINKYRLSDARRGQEPTVAFVFALLTKC